MRLGGLAAAGVLGLAAVCFGTRGSEAQTFQFKYTDYNPSGNFITNEIERWSKEIMDKSGGRVKIDVFPSSQMGPVPRQYDLVRTGVADFGFILLGIDARPLSAERAFAAPRALPRAPIRRRSRCRKPIRNTSPRNSRA